MKIGKLSYLAEYTCPKCKSRADHVPEQALPDCPLCDPTSQMLPSHRGKVYENWGDWHRGRLLRKGDWDRLEAELRQLAGERFRLAVRRNKLLTEAAELDRLAGKLDERFNAAAASLFYPHDEVQDTRQADPAKEAT